MSGFASPAVAPGWTTDVLKRMYQKSAARLMAEFGLQPAADIPTLSNWPEVRNGVVFAANSPLRTEESIVVGGPCIDHCDARLERLRCNIFIDILWPMCAALRLGRPCCLYLFVPMEKALVGEPEPLLEDWRRIGDRLEALAETVAARLGLTSFWVLRTDRAPGLELLEQWAAVVRHRLPSDRLRGLYAVGTGRGNGPLEAWLLRTYERNVTSYLPELLEQFLGHRFRAVIPVENIQQARAIAVSREVHRLGQGAEEISQIAYVTPPSLTCRSRMSRSPSAALFAGQPASEWRSRLLEADPLAQAYWSSWCPAEALERLQAPDPVGLLAGLATQLLEGEVR